MSAYLWFKLVHVISAIVAVGANLTYFLWLRRIRTADADRVFVLEGIQALDQRFANPAYILLLITGIGMVLLGDIGFSTFWIAVAIALYVAVAAVAGGFFTPALKRQLQLAQASSSGSAEYTAVARRTTVTGLATMVLIAVIIYLMVMKPV